MLPSIPAAITLRSKLKYDLAIFIGRFQFFHLGHLKIIEEALAVSQTVTLLVGSYGAPRSNRGPLTFDETKAIILASLKPEHRNRVFVQGLHDWTYNDARWTTNVQALADNAKQHFGLQDDAKVALAGHEKDGTSYYLKMFPQWDSIEVSNLNSYSATPMRDAYFLTNGDWKADIEDIYTGATLKKILPQGTIDFLTTFRSTETYTDIRKEFEFIREYRKPYENLPYGIIFQTVDSIVTQSGHILLIKRRARPGKGLWALPGGFLNVDETIENAVYRELREETKIKVPDAVLRGCTTGRRRFDAVHRSARGRIITDAFRIELPDNITLPKVKGADDAEKAKWIPLSDLRRDMMFEDHYAVISVMTGAF